MFIITHNCLYDNIGPLCYIDAMNSARSEYDPHDYPPVAVTVDVVVQTILDDALHVLLIERGEAPFLDTWALPGGFVHQDEDLDQAAERELEEETAVSAADAHLEQLGSYGDPDRDPRMRVVTVAYWAICARPPTPQGGTDAKRARFVPVSELESGAQRLAFDHRRILDDALERTRSKIEYTALAAKFCPAPFTITELRRVYEILWQARLDPGNFQRNLRANQAFLSDIGGRRPASPAGGRPASLWRLADPTGKGLLEPPLASRTSLHRLQ